MLSKRAVLAKLGHRAPKAPTYPQPRVRAAVVQVEPVHEECIPALVHLLRANAVDPTVFLNRKIRSRRGDIARQFPDLRARVNYVPTRTRQNRRRLSDQLRPFDLLVFNTFQDQAVTAFARNLDKPVLGVVHDPQLFMRTAAGVWMVRSGQAQLLTLASHVTAWMLAKDSALFSRVGTITSAFPRLPRVGGGPAEAERRRRLTVPGAVDFETRDYDALLAALPEVLGEIDRDRIEVAIIGGGRDRGHLAAMAQENGLADVVRFPELGEQGFLRNRAYYDELMRSTFLLPLLPEGMASSRTCRTASALPASVGLGIPTILDRWTDSVYRVPCVTYARGELTAGMRRAVAMPDEELEQLRTRLRTVRDLSLKQAVQETGLALENLGRGSAARPMPIPEVELGTLDRENAQDFLRFARRALLSSRAQRFQDLWALWEAGFAREGYFVEFGALDGKVASNSFLLERIGWKGTVAEPHPDYEEALRRNRSCTISTRCVYESTGSTVAFHAVRGRPTLSAIEGYGDKRRGSLIDDFEKVDVTTVSLLDLLSDSSAPATIDFLSIDTEGSELSILKSFDFGAYDIRCICVEHNSLRRDEIFDLLTDNGYRRKWPTISGHDDWYVRSDETPKPQAIAADTLQAIDDAEPYGGLLAERRRLLTKLLSRAHG